MRIQLRRATLDDVAELTEMYYDLISIVYPGHVQTDKFFYERNVIQWFADVKDIYVTYTDTEITGFLLGWLETFSGVIEPYYKAYITYIKEKYRLSRSTYLLYNEVLETYKDYRIEVCASTLTCNSKIISKFGNKTFETYERDAQ